MTSLYAGVSRPFLMPVSFPVHFCLAVTKVAAGCTQGCGELLTLAAPGTWYLAPGMLALPWGFLRCCQQPPSHPITGANLERGG